MTPEDQSRDEFEAWWQHEREQNSGHEIGADYRHWALLGWQASRRTYKASEAWQPIETAPKDGAELLLWREDCGQFIGSYTSGDAFPLTQNEIDQMAEEVLFQKDWFTQWPDARRLEGSELPTRWMCLPADPALAAKTQEGQEP